MRNPFGRIPKPNVQVTSQHILFRAPIKEEPYWSGWSDLNKSYFGYRYGRYGQRGFVWKVKTGIIHEYKIGEGQTIRSWPVDDAENFGQIFELEKIL